MHSTFEPPLATRITSLEIELDFLRSRNWKVYQIKLTWLIGSKAFEKSVQAYFANSRSRKFPSLRSCVASWGVDFGRCLRSACHETVLYDDNNFYSWKFPTEITSNLNIIATRTRHRSCLTFQKKRTNIWYPTAL